MGLLPRTHWSGGKQLRMVFHTLEVRTNHARTSWLLATFGEVERMSTSTRDMEKLSPSDGAVFPTLLRTGNRGETSKPP
jgi:hypothetical protein